jgi:hypothetical protein
MESIVMPPMAPPAMALAWTPEDVGGAVGDALAEDALADAEDVLADAEDVLTEAEDILADAEDVLNEDVYTLEAPQITSPGPYSGPSISNVSSPAVTRKIGAMMLTNCLTRFFGVPIILVLERVMITVPVEEKLDTNCDIESSPVRNIYSRRDRVREPGGQLQKSNAIDSQPSGRTYCEGGRIDLDVQLAVYENQLIKGKR